MRKGWRVINNYLQICLFCGEAMVPDAWSVAGRVGTLEWETLQLAGSKADDGIVMNCGNSNLLFLFVAVAVTEYPLCLYCTEPRQIQGVGVRICKGEGVFNHNHPQPSTTHFEDERAECTAVVSSSCLKIWSQPLFGGSYVWYDMDYFNPKILRCPRQSLLAMAYVPMSLAIFGGTKACGVVESQLVTIY